LHAGNFPMQMWDGVTEAENIAKRADDFLKKQGSNREARFATVLPSLYRVIEDSETLTVLIFSDGSQQLQGTPFDTVINRVYLAHRDEQRKIAAPFVTVLQARGGKLLHGAVSSAAAALTVPPVPAIPKPPTYKPVIEGASKKAAPVKILPSLVLDYSKSNPPASAPTTATAAQTTPGSVVPASAPAPTPVPVASTPAVAPSSQPSVPATSAPAELVPAPKVEAKAAPVAVAPAPAAPPAEPVRPPVSYPAARLEPAPAAAPVAPAAAPTTSVWPLMFGAGLIAGLIVAIVAVWFFTRGQSAPRRSVITESLERKGKS
jgi:hypothetical protein